MVFTGITYPVPCLASTRPPASLATTGMPRSMVSITISPKPSYHSDGISSTRVLLMPSLWYEGFGLIVMETMLRGIPVVASDAGGLVEAKQGTGYVIPVNTIERYEPVFDEHAMPRPVVRPNDAAPWVAALREL